MSLLPCLGKCNKSTAVQQCKKLCAHCTIFCTKSWLINKLSKIVGVVMQETHRELLTISQKISQLQSDLENSNSNISKYSLVQNKFRTPWIHRKMPIYDLFKCYVWKYMFCVLRRCFFYTLNNKCLIGEKMIIIIFRGYIFLCLPLYNSKF